ncbi:hypothetical protein [Cellulomonas septica]|uniref:YokE-like PH domain-containing protein n=1 Tax=Cellulomonas septica TaxID=285080 RepID=A0ABX1JZE1_9CELL|nr:hypothetical protein [Cellulomonas septica]NKY39698.1 hypothetical protein [Cellulomonas septica]
MISRTALVAAAREHLLEPGEEVLGVTHVQPKGAGGRNAAKTAGASAVLGVATLALTGGALAVGAVVSTEPIWCVRTDRRFLLVRRAGSGSVTERFLGELPHDAVELRMRRRILYTASFVDRATGDTLLRANLGLNVKGARALTSTPAAPGLTTA